MHIARRELLHLLGLGGFAFGASPWLAGCGSTPKERDEQGAAVCSDDWWLCNNYAPVNETEAFDLKVIGDIPSSLQGLYARNGANPASGSSDHWFSGDGMVHGLRLEQGKALWYRARYVQTELLGKPSDMQGIPGGGNHQANTSVIAWQNELLCLAEVGLPYRLDRGDLSTLGTSNFNGALGGAMTAHPKFDPATGELLFFGYGLFTPSVDYYAVDATSGAIHKHENLALPQAVMMHDFQITPNFAIFMDLPVLFDTDLAVAGEGMPFRWQPENGSRIGLLPRTGSAEDVQWFDIDNCYVFHTFNAFEDPNDDQKVVLDCIRYPKMWVDGSDAFNSNGQVWRYVLDRSTSKASGAILLDQHVEFPRIDPRKQGVANRYGYAVEVGGVDAQGLLPSHQLVKLDMLEGKEVSRYDVSSGATLDEALFVPDGDGEDEGWLLSYSYNKASEQSDLLIFDASDIAAGPAARVQLPTRVPHGFHGTFSAD